MMHIGDLVTSLGVEQDAGITRQGSVAKAAFAAYLRDNQTPSERMMARVLCHLGIEAEPQVPILGYIADFYDASTRTVIEVDGSIHDDQRAADAVRNEHMRAAGYRVYRVTNDEVRHFLANIAEARG